MTRKSRHPVAGRYDPGVRRRSDSPSSFAGLAFLIFVLGTAPACGWGSGSSWVKEPLVPEEERAPMQSGGNGASRGQPAAKTIGARPPSAREDGKDASGGKVLGTFRNTYYDFPSEAEHSGPTVNLMSATSCEPIAKVPRTFYEAVCVQGSGSLASGNTVSFGKRDCACAEVCPRTGQKICFEKLEKDAFPWGRGAAGTPITPLRSVAADTKVLPMGTVLYIPELDGVASGDRTADGCFVVEDRGLRVQGEHVDIFTGKPSQTATLNAKVPSNQGVTVIVDAPKCAYLTAARR
jgi:3D (Asp-Asp-Asp) domain-containing protein